MLEGRLGVAAGEFARFAVVGVVSNAALYLLYLLLTQLGLGHKMAASVTYAIGVLQTFVFNRRWSFRHAGAPTPALRRYIGAYSLGYALNILVLAVLVDRMGYPHQWVQGVMIIVLAVLLFAAQKLWVFREKGKR
jgi:putative flippase GtrA